MSARIREITPLTSLGSNPSCTRTAVRLASDSEVCDIADDLARSQLVRASFAQSKPASIGNARFRTLLNSTQPTLRQAGGEKRTASTGNLQLLGDWTAPSTGRPRPQVLWCTDYCIDANAYADERYIASQPVVLVSRRQLLGGRFSMNASTPSSALGSIMLQAIVAPASA